MVRAIHGRISAGGGMAMEAGWWISGGDWRHGLKRGSSHLENLDFRRCDGFCVSLDPGQRLPGTMPRQAGCDARGPVSTSEPNPHVATRCAHGIVLLPTLLYRHQSSKPSLNTAASSNTKSTPEMAPVPVMTMGVAVAVLIGLGEPQGRPKLTWHCWTEPDSRLAYAK